MFTLSLFTAPSKTDTVTNVIGFSLANAIAVIQKSLDDRTNDSSAPTYFSFSSWNRYHERNSYLGSSAVVLEYSKRSDAEWGLIRDAIEETGLKAFVFDSTKGIAFAFPVENCQHNNTYARMVSILAELIGQAGMVSDASATYLVKPKKGAIVYEIGDNVIPDNFTSLFRTIPADGLKQWTVPLVSQKPTRDISPPKPAQTAVTTGQAVVMEKPALGLDDFFDMLDTHLATMERSMTEFEAIRDILKASASQRGRGSPI